MDRRADEANSLRTGDSSLLFSYGSNMCRERLLARAPSAEILGKAFLPGHALRFHKESDVDGSGKADAVRTGRTDDRVWGVLARITDADVARLDEIEGVGAGYRVRRIEVHPEGTGSVTARLYVAEASAVRAGLRPFEWYRRLVVVGARQHDLPRWYVRGIRSVPARPDPDRERARRNLAVLDRGTDSAASTG